MQQTRYRSMAAIVAACAAVTASMEAHGDPVAVSGRNIQHVTAFVPMEIGEGRMLATVEAVGVTIDPDGEVTTNQMWGQLERVGGVGPDRGYFLRTWPDGSTTLERFNADAALDDNGAPVFAGTFEYVDGTGRFKGISGQGSFEGGRGHDNGMIVVDWQATMELPGQ